MLYPAELRARALESTTYGTAENTASRFCQPNRVRNRRRRLIRTLWTRERHVMLLQLRRGVDHRRLTSPYSPAASNSSPTSALAGTTGAGGRDEERRRLVETGVVRLLADHLRWPHAGQCLSRSVLRFGTPASMRQRGRGARRASTSAGRRTRPGSPQPPRAFLARTGGEAPASIVRRQLFAGRVASFEDVTRYPQNDRTRCLGRIGSPRCPGPGNGCPVVHPGPGGATEWAACQRWMRCSRRSATSRCTSSCTRSPARHRPGRRGGRPFGVFARPLRNGAQSTGGC